MLKLTAKTISILTVFVILILSLPAIAAQRKNDDRFRVRKGAEEVQLVHHDLSLPLRDIPPAPRKFHMRRVVPNRPLPKKLDMNAPVTAGTLDPVLQTFEGATVMAPSAANLSFNGVGDGFTGPQGTHDVNVAPPDPVHDVGPNHIVQAVNSSFAVLNKTGTVLYGPVNINTLWSGFGGGCQSNNDGDPTINYDQMADRWIIMQFSVSSTPYLQCVAVSQTADPTGAWYRFSYSFTDFNDYPKVGVWPDGYYVTYNMFTDISGYGKVCALDRSKLLTGAANTQQCFDTGSNMGLLASDMDGSTQPPAGSPNFIFNFDDANNRLHLWKFKVNWTTPSSSTFTGPTNISVAAFTESCVSATRGACIPQSGTTSKLEALADRLMNRVAYRNRTGTESIVLSHAVGGDTAAQIRWYEIRTPDGTPTVYQSGTYAPNSNWRWMPSIAMDKSGNIAVGYSVSSSSMAPDIYYTGRESTDALGTMGTEQTILSGVTRGSQVGTYGNPPKPLERWGDYAALVLDPSDDCTFWLTSEYIPSNGIFNWRTRIASFKFASCGGGGGDTTAPTTSVTAPSNGATVSGNVTISANASDNIGVTNVEFLVDGVSVGTDSTSPYSITWNSTTVGNGSHSITSRAYDAAGNTGTSSAVTVTVSNSGQAAFDSTLQAPKCDTASSFCDSGSLLEGRGTMSPAEPNQPNTINDSCADGSSGTYHSDESLDKLRVATNDGTNFAAGKTVTVTATVWCWGTADALDLYYAANANSPSWTLIGTQSCTVSGQSANLTATYTLPAGSLQAIRGNFRYQGSASSCTSGNYNDHDDLIFTVGAGSDTTPPTTSITAPANGATVANTITISATASDNVGVTKVEFYRGTTLLDTDTTSPFSISWDTTTVANGSYSLTSKAFDAANNTGTSSAVNVTVSNSDTTAPTTSITAPANGATVSGTITISANASDNVGVTKVEFYRGTTLLGTDTTSPFSISWNTTSVANGSYSLTSKAFDAANNTGTSSAVNVTVNNADTTAPTTSITSPTNGATVSGTITISANASDNIGVTRVEFYHGTTLIGTDTTSPYSASWDTTAVGNGSYSLTSKAFDAANNTGTSGAVNVTVNNVSGPPALTAAYNSTLKAPTCVSGGKSCDTGASLINGRANITGGAEPNQPNTINNSCADGTSGTYHSDESIDRMSIATNDSTAFAGGKAVTVSVTVWCYGTTDSLDLYYTSNASSPSWTLIGTQACTASGAVSTLTASYTLPSSGTQHAVRANYRYQGSQSSCSTGAYDDHDDLVFGVTQSADTTPPSTSITSPSNGATVNGTITVSASASDNVGVTKVEFYLDGSTLLGTDTTSPYSTSWNTTTVSNGNHSLTSKAFDAANNTTTSGAVTVSVSNVSAPPDLMASYDSILKAPLCVSGGKSCDTGASLINGRGTMSGGNETNRPNTINNTCADGNSGTYHSDESIDAMKIATNDGTAFASGKSVTVTFTVYCYSTADRLDIYRTATASSPSWTLVGTQQCSGSGVKTMTATFTLPTGSQQAVRGNFRYNGSASSCSTGSYDDHDDLVFGVQ